MKTNVRNRMRDVTSWADGELVQSFCAEQLALGRLALVLGAGVSMACGLPKWSDLTARCCRLGGRKVPSGLNGEKTAEWLLMHCCGGEDAKFAALVQKALYEDYTLTGVELTKTEMLTALAALSFPSARGGVYRIITFNFDDLLEQLLRSFGVCVEPVWELPVWESRADVRVYHPHGYLPAHGAGSRRIVMAQKDFDRIHGGEWRVALLDILRTHTCLFVGLSGDDQNLLGLMTTIHREHVSLKEQHPFWGVRIDGAKGTNDFMWTDRGVRPIRVKGYDRIPGFLRGISQAAALNL